MAVAGSIAVFAVAEKLRTACLSCDIRSEFSQLAPEMSSRTHDIHLKNSIYMHIICIKL